MQVIDITSAENDKGAVRVNNSFEYITLFPSDYGFCILANQ